MAKKSEWINYILEVLKDFADLDLQYREWVRGENNSYSSFQESMCQLNDNACFEEIIENYANCFNFSPRQYQALCEFHKAVNDYADEHGTFRDDAELMQDPVWHDVVKKAQAVIDAFKDYRVLEDTEFTIRVV